MAHIVNNFLSKKEVVLGREDFIRPLSFGNNWSKIRVAVRYSIFRTWGDISKPQFGLGVCSGPSSGYNSITSDWLGGVFGGTPTGINGDWSNYGSNPNVYSGPGSIGNPCRKLGVIYNNANSTASTTNMYNVTDGESAYVQLIDINRTANWTQAVVGELQYAYDYHVVTNVSKYAYMTAIENETAVPSFMAGFWYAGTLNIGPVYDHVCITWGKSIPAIILFDITVLRFN